MDQRTNLFLLLQGGAGLALVAGGVALNEEVGKQSEHGPHVTPQ